MNDKYEKAALVVAIATLIVAILQLFVGVATLLLQ